MKHVFLIFSFLLATASGFSQEFQVSGTVTDGKTPLKDVLVKVEGSSRYTQTSAAGEYTLKLEEGIHHLIFSFGNKKRIRIELSEDMELNVDMSDAEEVLEEVFPFRSES